MAINKTIKKRTNKQLKIKRINLIIPSGCNHDLLIPNYNNHNYNLIILKNNDFDIVIPNV